MMHISMISIYRDRLGKTFWPIATAYRLLMPQIYYITWILLVLSVAQIPLRFWSGYKDSVVRQQQSWSL